MNYDVVVVDDDDDDFFTSLPRIFIRFASEVPISLIGYE